MIVFLSSIPIIFSPCKALWQLKLYPTPGQHHDHPIGPSVRRKRSALDERAAERHHRVARCDAPSPAHIVSKLANHFSQYVLLIDCQCGHGKPAQPQKRDPYDYVFRHCTIDFLEAALSRMFEYRARQSLVVGNNELACNLS